MSLQNDKLTFLVDWMEPLSAVPRKFILTFYPADNSISMFDTSKKKYFLSRTVCNTVTKPNLFVGNTVNVLSRQLKIVEYGDITTKNAYENSTKRLLVVLQPRAFKHLGCFLNVLHDLTIEIKNIRMLTFNEGSIQYLKKWSPKSQELAGILSESPVVVMELSGLNVSLWKQIDLQIEDFCSNVYCSEDKSLQVNELNLLFGSNKHLGVTTARFSASSCCIIKPHAIIAGHSGKIIEELQKAGFEITALEMFHLTIKEVDEFLEVYKGLVSNYECILEEMASGPCLVMEIQGPKLGTVATDLKQLAGPSDPVIGRALRPGSLRAKFGIDKIRNALHCTDLPEDAELEVEYFFKFHMLK